MADAHQLRDLAASYRMRGSKEGSDLVACYNLDMATYLDYMAAIWKQRPMGRAG